MEHRSVHNFLLIILFADGSTGASSRTFQTADAIIFVAEREFNGRMLYAVCKIKNPDTYFVSP
jgi:hypothetical protein